MDARAVATTESRSLAPGKMTSSAQITKGALLSYTAVLFNILTGLVYTPWMVREIGRSDYGLYVLVTSFLSYFLMDFGLGASIARFVAKYRAENDDIKVNQLLGLATRLYLVIGLVLFVVLAIVFFYIEVVFVELNTQEIEKFRIVYCIAGIFAVLSFPFTPINGILIGFERFAFLKGSEWLQKVAFVVFLGIALSMGYKLYALVIVNVGIGTVITAYKLGYLWMTTTVRIDLWYSSRQLFRELLGFSCWIGVIGIAQRMLLNIVPTILGIFCGTAQIAVFSVGMMIEGYTWTFANALNGLFLPRVSEMWARGETLTQINRLMIRVGRIQLVLVGFLFVGIISLGNQFIVLWMGPEFESSFYVALFLVLPGTVTLTQEIASTLVMVTNRVKYRALILFGGSIVSVAFSMILAPSLGAIGSGVAICIAMVLFQVVGMNLFYWKVVKLDIPGFFRGCHQTMALPLGLSLAVGYCIQVWVPSHSLLTFFPKAVLFAAVYLVAMWVLGLDSDEKQFIRAKLGRMIIAGTKQ